MRFRTLSAVAALGVLASLSIMGMADAFCIYNRSNQKLGVIQESGGQALHSFQADISPGGQACCNWRNADCNKEGKKTSILTFTVPRWYEDNVNFCTRVRVQAGGWLTLEGKGTDITCHPHDAE